jgi:hypothetical protein
MNNPFQSYNRGYTARERRIRTKYASLFLITGLTCIWLAVKVANMQDDLEKTEAINSVLQHQTVKMQNQIDSLEKECADKDSLLTERGVTDLMDRIDSLRGEAFIASTVNGRYELSLEYLKGAYPKAAKEFENFMNTQTE